MKTFFRATVICTFLILFTIPLAQGARLSGAEGSDSNPPVDPNAKVTIDFRDVDVRVVAQFISELTGKNFVFDKQVREKVTVFSPTEVTVKEAYHLFETVLKIHGYTTIPTNGLIKIVPSLKARTMAVETREQLPQGKEAREDRVVTQIIKLRHADADELRTLLQPLVDKTALIMSYSSGNFLLVTDYASNINRLVEIVKTMDVMEEGTQLQVITLEHASAKDLAQELQEILEGPAKTRGKKTSIDNKITYKVVTDERTNSLVVMGRAAEIRMIRGLVRKLDLPSRRGSGRIHLLFLKNAVAEELAAVLTELTGNVQSSETSKNKGAAPTPLVLQEPVYITADTSTNALLIRAERQDFLVLKEIIDKLDIRRSQVLVEGVIMEMNMSTANNLGAEWRLLNNLDSSSEISGFGGTSLSGLINELASNPYSSSASGLILGAAEGTLSFGGTTFLNLGLLIQALEQNADVNILSTPHLLTMDNEEAKIVVGEERPFLKSSLSTATGDASTSITRTYDFKDLGLTLKITPHITQGEYIKLKIYQELKSYLNETETGAISSTKRETETTVQVKNRETVVIGGLITDETRETKNQVPCLGNIPLAGWAFKYREQSQDKVNLIVMIKPTIIRTADQLREITEKKKRETESLDDDKKKEDKTEK